MSINAGHVNSYPVLPERRYNICFVSRFAVGLFCVLFLAFRIEVDSDVFSTSKLPSVIVCGESLELYASTVTDQFL